ncbi:MAG: ChaN family lipoprotein [Sedimenticola sp.]|nr:ChaN family lipoprotein [Sedimenticola sp.]
MVIARYALFLLLIVSFLSLGACGNTVLRSQAVPGNAHAVSDQAEVGAVPEADAAVVLNLKQTLDIDRLIPILTHQRVVFIGETHDNFAHHRAQLELIRSLHRAGADLAIGMEMFQQPFQSYLDDFVSGTITEGDMLRGTEWYQRWVYDYRHYRPILQFAREQGIPVIALNVPRELTGAISEKGLEALDPQQRSQLPAEFDFSDRDYSARLRTVFDQHAGGSGRSFERFEQVQLAWDEGMAETAADYLADNPGKQLVVLAGSGHLMHGSGIPNRVKRRQSVSSAIVLPGGDLRLQPGIADYVVFPKQEKLPPAALIGIYMEESEEGVRVSRLAENGAAAEAGIKPDDIILDFDGNPIRSTIDLRIGLLDRQPGEKVSMTVLRRGLLFGEERVEMDVVLGQ